MTQILQPLADLLGMLMNAIFNGISAIGIANIGIAIIIMTIIIKMALLPLTISQQKTANITRLMQPEIKAIRARYRGRRDTASQQMMSEEIKAIYSKYGASQTGGCIQLVVQMPILFALYSVFRNIPQYITAAKTSLLNIIDVNNGIASDPNFIEKMKNNFGDMDWTNQVDVVNKMNAFQPSEWGKLKEIFPQFNDLITSNADTLAGMNNFLGVNVAISPNQIWGIAILIPIFSGVSQLISAWLSQSASAMGDDKGSQITQKIMIFMMPIFSVFIAFQVPAGLGIYWITTAVVTIIQQLIINAYFNKVGMETIVKKSLEKKQKRFEKKMAKKGVSQEELIRSASIKTKKINNGYAASSNASFKDRANVSSSKAKAKNIKAQPNKINEQEVKVDTTSSKKAKKQKGNTDSLASIANSAAIIDDNKIKKSHKNQKINGMNEFIKKTSEEDNKK